MPPPRVLIVAYTFPPMPTIGANRWEAMARHLRRLGHEVSIVSTGAFGRMRDADEELVIRTPDLTAAPWLRRALRRGPLPPPSHAPRVERAAPSPESPLPEALRKLFVPDLYLAAWLPWAIASARRELERRRVDCLITTSPYESTHLVGLALHRQAAWVADFRDGWLFEPHRPPFPTAAQRALDRWMEMRVARGADRVVSATRPVATDMSERLGIEAIHVANGFDPLKHPVMPPLSLPDMPPETFTVAHTGKLAGVNKRDPRGLFEALRRLSGEAGSGASRLRFLLAGRLDTHDLRLLEASGVRDQIIHLGELSHAESLALQREADALLLIASEGSEVTGKLFEYLSAGRPIIALGGREIARIVSATRTGVVVDPGDVEAIAKQLRRLLSGELSAAYRPVDLEPYVYPGPAVRMAGVIEQAIASHARSHG